MTTTATTTSTLRFDGRWIKGRVDGLDVCALAFTEPSTYGIGGNEADLAGLPLPATARISKLWVAVPTTPGGGEFVPPLPRSSVPRRSPHRAWGGHVGLWLLDARLRTCVYDYDRGEMLVADQLLPGELETVIAAVLAVEVK